MGDLAAMLAALGVRVPPEELARILQGARDDMAAAQAVRAWLARQ